MYLPKSVEDYILSQEKWEPFLKKLREIILSTELEETLKWGIPTYTLQNKNVVGLAAFTNYAGLWFFNGVFLSDKKKLLINAQEGTTKGQRQWRFTSLNELDENLILAYLDEAIENQRSGKEVKAQKKPIQNSPLLDLELTNHPKLKQFFDSFSLAKQQEFVRYIEEAKREETKFSRLEKIKPLILERVGLNDKYRS